MNLFLQVSLSDVNQGLTFEIIAIVLFAIIGAEKLMSFIGHFRSKPPINEKLQGYQTKNECEKRCERLTCDIAILRKESVDELNALRKSSSASRKALHETTNATRADIAAIKKENEIQSQRICELSGKFDRFLDKQIR